MHYASVNKRVRSLKESGYIKSRGVKKTKAGFKTSIYELTVRAYLVMLLDSIDFEKLVMEADETIALAILGDILHV